MSTGYAGNEIDLPNSSRRAWDIAALVLLLIGGIILPILGWIIGVVILWASPTWTNGEKVLGTFVVPLGLLLPVSAAFFLAPWGTCTGGKVLERLPDGTPELIGPSNCEYSGGIPGSWLAILCIAFVVASIGTVIYLARRMRRATPVA
jgi:hypothetical protein